MGKDHEAGSSVWKEVIRETWYKEDHSKNIRIAKADLGI